MVANKINREPKAATPETHLKVYQRGKAASTNKRVFGRSELTIGKLETSPLAQPPIECPECGSPKVWKNGFKFGVQTFLCGDCSRRFLDPAHKSVVKFNVFSQSRKKFDSASDLAEISLSNSDLALEETLNNSSFPFCEDVTSHEGSRKSIVGKNINAFASTIVNAKVCAKKSGAENFAEVKAQNERPSVGGTNLTEADFKGKLVKFIFWMQKQPQNYSELTIEKRAGMLRTLYNAGANLYDPDAVILNVRIQKWCDGTKANAICTYACFCKAFNISVGELPKYNRIPKLPFIPLETEIDQLISGASKKVGTFLQTLKEVGCRAGEAWSLKWIDLDSEHNIITINNPEKHGLSRQVKVSSKLMSMIQALSKKDKLVFGDGKLCHFRKNFMIQRKRVAKRVQNPRIEQIHFHTLRHWHATMLYHKTKSILHVKQRLGHRSVTSTEVYTHLVNFESDEYVTKRTNDINEAEELLKAGFDYVTDMDGYKMFRKPK